MVQIFDSIKNNLRSEFTNEVSNKTSIPVRSEPISNPDAMSVLATNDKMEEQSIRIKENKKKLT